jgi:hypothetical protein
MRKPSRPTFLLRLQPLKGVDPVRALRHALKRLLRDYGMRAPSQLKRSVNRDFTQRRSFLPALLRCVLRAGGEDNRAQAAQLRLAVRRL